MKAIVRPFSWLVMLVLAACNLQSEPPATATLTAEPPPAATSTLALSPTSALPPLQATPTQMPLLGQPQVGITVIATTNAAITPNGTPLPGRFDPALADQRSEVEAREDGDTIGIVYEVTINSGSILMVLQGEDGIVWQMTLTASANTRADVTVPKAGTYELLIDAQNLSGGYTFRFE